MKIPGASSRRLNRGLPRRLSGGELSPSDSKGSTRSPSNWATLLLGFGTTLLFSFERGLPRCLGGGGLSPSDSKGSTRSPSRTIAQPSFEEVYKKRVVDKEGCSKIVSKETTIRDHLGESSSTPKVTDGTIDTSTKDLKESRPKARQPEYNVLEVNVDGTYKMTSAKDSRGFTHISQAAADKADEEYAKNCAQASDASLDGDNIVETDDFIKNESDSGFGTSRARNMIPVGGWATDSPNESRETSPMRTIQAVAEATDSFPVSGLNRPDDVTSGMSALSLEKTNSRSNSSQSFLLPNTEVRSENSS
ncbi:hypothetical protein ACHAP3_004371 [Botrytis cinerea]